MEHHPPAWAQYGVPVAIFALVMAMRMWRMKGARPRRLRLEMLWVVPMLLALGVGALIATKPPHGLEWLLVAVALALGAALGWQRGKTMRIDVDPATHRLNQRASPATLLFLGVLFLLKLGLRDQSLHVSAMQLSATVVGDMLAVFGFGVLGVARAEMFVRGRRLLAEHRGLMAGAA